MKTQTILLTVLCTALCACAAETSGTAASSPDASPAEGKQAPELRLQSRSGEEIDLTELKGKVVIVDFWASWCDPCKEELPVLERFYAEHHDRGLEILAVSIDEEREAADELLSRLPVSFPVLYDTEHEVVSRWQPPKMPTSYIIDRDGKISAVQAGFKPEEADALEARILAQLE